MAGKVFKNLDEQIEIFKSKGLIIIDYDKTKEVLFRENYFFVNGYRHLFMRKFNDTQFINGTTFEELHAVFMFDRHMRNIMFKNLLIIENNIKSIISYQLSKKYGFREKDYLDLKNFSQDSMKIRQVYDVLNKMKRQIRVNGRQHSATVHYLSNYGYIPLWVLVKVLSFGIIGEVYSILKVEDQAIIAGHYNLEIEDLTIYLALLSNYRNLCAHEDILYDHRTQRSIPNCVIHKNLNIEQADGEYIYGKNDLFALLIIMKYMLSDSEFSDLENEIGYEIDKLDGLVDTVPLNSILNRIGFPDNWRDISRI